MNKIPKCAQASNLFSRRKKKSIKILLKNDNLQFRKTKNLQIEYIRGNRFQSSDGQGKISKIVKQALWASF